MLSGLPLGQAATAAGALALVVAFILVASRAARLLPSLRLGPQTAGEITLRGSLALDSRRRIYLLDAGGTRALVLTGGETDVLLGLPSLPC